MSQPDENRLVTSVRYTLYLLTASDVLLSGYASSGVGSVAQTTRTEYYPSCYEPMSHLCSTDNAMHNSVIIGAITGGLLNGLAGGLINDESHDRNAALAAAGGALAGGVTGYYMEKQKQASDDRARVGSYATDVDHSTVEVNRGVACAKSAQSCCRSQLKALLDGRKNKSINGAKERKHPTEIVSSLQETNTPLVAANGRAGENINNYTQAYEKGLQQVGVSRTEVIKVAETENCASTTEGGSKPRTGSNPKVPRGAVATEQAIRKTQGAQSKSNKMTSRDQGMIQEVYNSPDMGDWTLPSCAKA